MKICIKKLNEGKLLNLTEELAAKFEQALGISTKSWMIPYKGYIEDNKAIEKRNYSS